MNISSLPAHRKALAVDFYCTVARNGLTDRGEIRSLAAEMFAIPIPYDKNKVEALVVYIASHIFDLAGAEAPRSEEETQEQLALLIARNAGSTALLDKTA